MTTSFQEVRMSQPQCYRSNMHEEFKLPRITQGAGMPSSQCQSLKDAHDTAKAHRSAELILCFKSHVPEYHKKGGKLEKW